MKKISKILKYELQINKSSWLYIMLVAFFISFYLLYNVNKHNPINLEFLNSNFAGGVILAFSGVLTLLSFPELKSKFYKQNYLLLPVSINLKFAARQLGTFILAPLLTGLLFFILQLTIGIIWPWKEATKIQLLQSVNFLQFGIMWIFIHSITSLFAQIVTRNTLIKFLLTYLFIGFLGPLIFELIWFNLCSATKPYQSTLNSISHALIYVAPLPCYILSYFVFKNKHI